jgi:hypothetical protein
MTMERLFSIAELRKKAGILHLFGVVTAIATLVIAQNAGAAPQNPCTPDMRNCVAQASGKMVLLPFETRHFDVTCPQAAPYYQQTWQSETTGPVSIVTWSWTGLVANNREHFSTTNWSVKDPHAFNIAIACSSSVPTGSCVAEPDCHEVEGSRRDTCAGGGESEMCWSNWNLTCGDGTHCSCSTVTLRVCCNCQRR